ncbi:MAG: hypothetical protein PHV63_03390 [Candidatus Daviesbacteria bacterium]|nr:hypothetical protein [Candidatus Daviesbacteria bacterium]
MASAEWIKDGLTELARRASITSTVDRSGGLGPITWVRRMADRVNVRRNSSSVGLDPQLKQDLEALGLDLNPPSLLKEVLFAPFAAAVLVLRRAGFE